jgi:hypothetical protein
MMPILLYTPHYNCYHRGLSENLDKKYGLMKKRAGCSQFPAELSFIVHLSIHVTYTPIKKKAL